jgi:hypothetical protein
MEMNASCEAENTVSADSMLKNSFELQCFIYVYLYPICLPIKKTQHSVRTVLLGFVGLAQYSSNRAVNVTELHCV